MTIANVALTNTFDEWRIRTNQIITVVNDIEDNNVFTAVSNTAAINVTPSITRGGVLYISANVITSDSDTATANIASANLANIINERVIASFAKANAANYFAYLVNANLAVAEANTAAAFAKANAANYFAYLVNANTVAAFDAANAVSVTGVSAFNRANVANNLATNAAVGTINFVLSGGEPGATVANGSVGDLIIPFNAYISSWALLADVTANTIVDIYKTTYDNYGTGGAPNSTNTITGTEQLTLSSATKNTSTALTGWTTTINTNDVLRFNVNSTAAATKLTIALKVVKT